MAGSCDRRGATSRRIAIIGSRAGLAAPADTDRLAASPSARGRRRRSRESRRRKRSGTTRRARNRDGSHSGSANARRRMPTRTRPRIRHRTREAPTATAAMASFHSEYAGRREQRGNREKERELGGGDAREAEQHAADDRGARTRRAGDSANACAQPISSASVQRIASTEATRIGVGARALPALRPEDHERAGDERARDRHRRKEMRLDRAVEGEPQQGGRQERDRTGWRRSAARRGR